MSRQLGRTIALLLILVFVLAGCGAQPTPQIVRETVPVPMTVIVQQTVEVTRVVTAIPTPRPTATATPAVTPTPVVVVPAGWVTYTHPAGAFTVAVPPDAEVSSEDNNSVTFEQPGMRGIVIIAADEPVGVVGDEDSINDLVGRVLGIFDSLDTVKVLDKGFSTTPVSANFVELSVVDYVYKDTSYRMMLTMPTSATTSLWVSALQRDRRMTDQQKAEIETIMSTIRLKK